jgi:hypothetical protein
MDLVLHTITRRKPYRMDDQGTASVLTPATASCAATGRADYDEACTAERGIPLPAAWTLHENEVEHFVVLPDGQRYSLADLIHAKEFAEYLHARPPLAEAAPRE